MLWIYKVCAQVSEELGDKIQILKIDTDENPDLSNQLRVSHPTDIYSFCFGSQHNLRMAA